MRLQHAAKVALHVLLHSHTHTVTKQPMQYNKIASMERSGGSLCYMVHRPQTRSPSKQQRSG